MKIKELKRMYIEYFEDVPVQKYAAEFIGRDEDTIIRWKSQDKKFADAVKRAKAIWIRKKFIATKAEFALEKLEAEVFNKASLPVQTPAYNSQISIHTEQGREILRKHTEFMLEITKSKTPPETISKLRNVKDYQQTTL